MLYNEILVNRINEESFPENTDSVILSLSPELDILSDYIQIFRREYKDSATKIYNIVRVYLVKVSTKYYDNRPIMLKMTSCINDAFKEYNTMGNMIYVQRFNWGTESDYYIIEHELLDIIYKETLTDEKDYATDGTLHSYILYYKESTDNYFGSADFHLENDIVTVEIEYGNKKPTKNKFIKDVTTLFCEKYNVVIEK